MGLACGDGWTRGRPANARRNTDALLLTAGQLPWATLREGAGELNEIEQAQHHVAPLGIVRADPEAFERALKSAPPLNSLG